MPCDLGCHTTTLELKIHFNTKRMNCAIYWPLTCRHVKGIQIPKSYTKWLVQSLYMNRVGMSREYIFFVRQQNTPWNFHI